MSKTPGNDHREHEQRQGPGPGDERQRHARDRQSRDDPQLPGARRRHRGKQEGDDGGRDHGQLPVSLEQETEDEHGREGRDEREETCQQTRDVDHRADSR
jgi:hypothetical protein